VLIGFMCIHFSAWTDSTGYHYYEVITICVLIMAFVFYVVHLFRLHTKLTCINWSLTEFLHYAIGSILLLIASIVAASRSSGYGGLVAGAFFGFVATLLCALSIWLSYKVCFISQAMAAAL
uniref:CKLF like MARVEL transmembrane domain containing 7 n=1 Tax=Latimeria chalumnae TaxID=7897 RepID=H3B078_LATCH